MPITRKQLSAAASTSNPPLNNSKSSTSTAARNLPVSDDDLFEQNAIQVSSASRHTRTINHQIPKELRKQLTGAFAAVATSLENVRDVGNKPILVGSSSKTLVKRSVAGSAGNVTKRSAAESPKCSPTIVPVEKPNLISDSIFDVPVSSPSPIRTTTKGNMLEGLHGVNNVKSNNFNSVKSNTVNNVKSNTANSSSSKSNNILNNVKRYPEIEAPVNNSTNSTNPFPSTHLHTPVKSANSKNVLLTTPSRPIIAGVRRTPLTFAEKRRRQNVNDEPETKKTTTEEQENVNVDVLELASEFVAVNNNNNNNKHKHENQKNNEPAEEEVSICVDLTTEKENDKAAVETNQEVQKSAQLSSTTKKRRRIFIRNQATESAPPEIKSSEPVKCVESVKVVESTPTESVNAKSVESSLEISLVIEVPPPPKLEDLETLDPELYVKLKSGNLKDDPTVPFISETDRVDIENFLETFGSPELARTMLPVAIIGEGTFSTVYKVIDRTFYECENSMWLEYSRQNPLDWLRLWRWVYEASTESSSSSEKFILYRDGKRCVDRHGRSIFERKSGSNSGGGRLAFLLRRYLLEWAMRGLDSLLPGSEATESVLSTISPRVLQSAMLRFRPYFIALKRINATSSPQRILDEISFLKHFGGKNNVVPMISGVRSEDQVLVTFPYFYSEEFREFLSSPNLSINSIACYMRSLFISLAHLHAHNVIHRDVKPSNFLYAPENGGRAVLLDFGLAQKVSSSSSSSNPHQRSSTGHRSSTGNGTLAQQHRIHNNRNAEKERKKLQAVNIILNTIGTTITGDDPCDKITQLTLQLGPGYFNNDPRAGMKASRAGTRGFRAPEVLFKHSNQTTALDIWSAGVILLTLLTRRYPFFQSSDDFDAIVEIANIFGNEEMSAAAKIYNRKWQCNLPSVPEKHVTWPVLCEKLNPSFVPEIPPECFDLLRECLNLNSEKRITARLALKHEFILKYAK